jgi:hypothetical protein
MSRGEQITTERRRRNSETLSGRRQRMSVDMSKLDQENYAYRWVNDVGNRLHAMTVQDDWDVVQDRDGSIKPNATGTGSEVSVVVGTDNGGAPIRSVLLRKRKEYYNDDAAAKTRAIDEKEAGLKTGAVPGASAGEFYSSSGITVENGARRRG